MNKLSNNLTITLLFSLLTASPALAGSGNNQATIDFNHYLKNIEMVSVQGGCFQMGSSSGRPSEKPVHDVCVSNFQIGTYEVTQGLWQVVMGSNPSHFQLSPDHPVEMVSWQDTQKFLKKLNQLTGKNYRLPTEAEWEYACFSGSSDEEFCGSNNPDEVAWFDNKGGKNTKQVGTKKPNKLGIYDMSGNIEEWTQDWLDFNYYASSPRNNPTGPAVKPEKNFGHVVRGGEWNCGDWVLRARGRESGGKNDRAYNDRGFRLAHPGKQ